MGHNQSYKLLYNKGNQKKKKKKKKKKKRKTAYWMGENICKLCDQQGLNVQNIQTVHTPQ